MPRFSPSQARLAKALVSGEKTAAELRDGLGLPLNEIETHLGELIKLKLVEKLGGYPTKYRAVESVRNQIDGKNTTEGHTVRAHILIEGQSKEKKALENAMKDLLSKLEKDKIISVSNPREDEIVKDEGVYSTLFEADVATKSFEDMMYVILTYGPSSIEIDPIKDYALTTNEAQGIAMDVATVLQAYASTLVQKDLQVREKELQMQEMRKKSPEIFIK